MQNQLHLYVSIRLSQMIRWVRIFDNANTTSFLVRNKELMEKCNKICDNASNIMKKGFNSEPVYSNKYFKAETESYNKINTNFHDSKVPKEGSMCSCLSKIAIDLVFKIDIKYYPEVFLEECKHKITKINTFITDDTETSSEDEGDSNNGPE